MRVLVTGAAGYVGSTVVSALLDAGDTVVGLDDLSRGRRDFLARVPHVVGDIADPAVLEALFDGPAPFDALVHCAGRTLVDESVRAPLLYYRENVAKTLMLLDTAVGRGRVRRVVFSSTAAVYGRQPARVVDETAPTVAASPYAAGKLMVERILGDLAAEGVLEAVSLRYFNPIGADPQLRSGRTQPSAPDVLSALFAAARSGQPFVINGADWDTDDGTPVRDLVHVADVARAHVAAVHTPLPGPDQPGGGHQIVNIGSGVGTTVRRLAEIAGGLVPWPVEVVVGSRRPGDTVGCRADVRRATDLLGWYPTATVEQAVRDALRWADRLANLDAAADVRTVDQVVA